VDPKRQGPVNGISAMSSH